MNKWWPIWGKVPAEPVDGPTSTPADGIRPLVDMTKGNKHVPVKHALFPNRMNRNKRMP
jgi:hypothetical protein